MQAPGSALRLAPTTQNSTRVEARGLMSVSVSVPYRTEDRGVNRAEPVQQTRAKARPREAKMRPGHGTKCLYFTAEQLPDKLGRERR